MRRILAIVFVLLTGLIKEVSAREPVFKVVYAPLLAEFTFLEQLGSSNPEAPARKAFRSSEYNTQEYRDLLALFDTLQIDYHYEFGNYPEGLKTPGMTRTLLRQQLINAADINSFRLASAGIIPFRQLDRLCRVLAAFEPVYRNLVYEPNRDTFKRQLQSLEAFVAQGAVERFFSEALVFYGAEWSMDMPFRLVFYPVPETGGFSAAAYANTAECALPAGLSNNGIIFGVLMHEIFHILYDEMPVSPKMQLRQWFMDCPARSNVYAYYLLDEVLATGLGNGYVYAELSGHEDTGQWYNRSYVDLMARKMYPLIREYIRDGRSLDLDFVNVYLDLYEASYPRWYAEAANIMAYRMVLTDTREQGAWLFRKFPYTSNYRWRYPVEDADVEELAQSRLTKVVLLSKDNEARLSQLKNVFPGLEKRNFKAAEPFIYPIFLDDHTWLIIINLPAKDPESFLDKNFPKRLDHK